MSTNECLLECSLKQIIWTRYQMYKHPPVMIMLRGQVGEQGMEAIHIRVPDLISD